MSGFGKPLNVDGMSEDLQRQIRAQQSRRALQVVPNQLQPRQDRARAGDSSVSRVPAYPDTPKSPRAPKGPNKTELEAFALFPYDFAFEGRVFDICGGAKYTPDGVDLKRAVALEAKGEFIHSRDSRRRFDEARTLYPGWTWIWARKRDKGRKGRRWEIEIYQSAWKNPEWRVE